MATSRRRSRRTFLQLSGLGLVGVGLAACATPGPPAGGKPTTPPADVTPAASTAGVPPPAGAAAPARTQTLKVGHLTRQLGNLVPLYPEVGPKHGVTFEVTFFPDGAALLQALSSGDVLLAAPTKVQLVQAMQRGVDLLMVVGYAGGYSLYLTGKRVSARADDWSSIKSLAAEKKGRGETFKIGTPTGSLQHITLLQQLHAAGIDASRDLEVINVPFAEHVNVLDAGQVDMVGTLALFAAQAILQDKGTLFKHAVDTPLRRFDVGFVTTRKLATERPADIQAVVNAHYDAMKNIVDDPTHGLEREVKYTELPEAVVKKSYEFLTFDYRVDVDAIRGTEQAMRQTGLQKEDLAGKIAEYVDLSYLSKASAKSVEELSRW